MTAPADTAPTRVRRLAKSPRPLAEVLVDALRRATMAAAELDEPDEFPIEPLQLELLLDRTLNLNEIAPGSSVHALRPGEVGAAILLGRAFDRQRQALARLQDPDTIAIIEVPSPDYIDPIVRQLLHQLLGSDVPVVNTRELRDGSDAIEEPGTVALFTGKKEDKGKKSADADADAELASAIARRCAIVAVAADPDRLLSPQLCKLAELHFLVSPFDASAVAAVIEAVTGRRPAAVDEQLAKRVTLKALALAVRGDLGPERTLERLRRLVGSPTADADAGPLLSQMHGLGAAKQWGLNLAADLRAYAAGKIPWSAVDKGCLLTGAPGVGKTSFARALAREAGVYFVATSYSKWQAHKEGHLGHVTQAIRNAFAEARQNIPAIVFIDEIDTIAARGRGKWNADWWHSIATTLLEQLDGFERREGVVVIAACNDPSRLDPALIRAGRLDRHIEIPLPSLPALMGIFRTHLQDDLAGADLRSVALAARGRTGADVERWVREARGRARREGVSLTLALLLDVVRGGVPPIPLEVRRRIANHEAGHAIANVALGIADPVSLSIHADGGLTQAEFGEMRALTRAHLEQYLVVLLAGRAAEDLVFGDTTASAGGSEESDLARATALALRLESSYGLGASGLLWMAPESAHDLVLHRELQHAVRATLDQAYTAAKDLLAANRASLDALAEALVANSYLDQADIEAVLARVPLGTTHSTETPAVEPPRTQATIGDGEPQVDAADDGSSGTALGAVVAGSIEA